MNFVTMCASVWKALRKYSISNGKAIFPAKVFRNPENCCVYRSYRDANNSRQPKKNPPKMSNGTEISVKKDSKI